MTERLSTHAQTTDMPVLHPRTTQSVEQFLAIPRHALLLTGSDGIGKTYVALYIAAKLLGIPTYNKVTSHPYVYIVSPDEKNTISVETVRDLQHQLRLATTGKNSIRRIVIIEHASAMTGEAQNAFLKLLEEPPSDTVIILTAVSRQSLLSTIVSRTQVINLHIPPKTAVLDYFSTNPTASFSAPSTVILERTYMLSGGLPGLMTALTRDDSQHPLTAGVEKAKMLLAATMSDRLKAVTELSGDKGLAHNVFLALGRIAETGLEQAARQQSDARIKQWHKVLKASAQALNAQNANANPKLVLTNLMLNL